MKKEVIKEIKRRSKQYNISEENIFDAKVIGDFLNLSRNTISQYLNELYKEHKVIKINTRPVKFFDKATLESRYNIVFSKDTYSTIDELIKNCVNENEINFVGADGSLKSIVEQCQAAIAYPGNGLPLLIHGPTGSGKSMMAKLLYKYAIDNNIIEKNKKLVSVNCSEYTNNPELLTANLFGYVKGAYTGAEGDGVGLVQVANGGILFLDEIHCLPPECQEKLFLFMDSGVYHKLGDNEHVLKSKTHLVFATTENPQDVLLKTLLRRIPIIVEFPSLAKRPMLEKKKLIYNILKKQSLKINKKILISNLAYQTLMDYEFVGNVGELDNVIKAICANALISNYEKDELNIKINNLPNNIFITIPSVQTKQVEGKELMLDLDKLNKNQNLSNTLLGTYEQILNLNSFFSNNNSFVDFTKAFGVITDKYFDYITFKKKYRHNNNDAYVLKIFDKVCSIIINKYALSISNSKIKIFSDIIMEYSSSITDVKLWSYSNREKVEQVSELVKRGAIREYNIAKDLAENIKVNLDVEIDEIMVDIFAMSFYSYQDNNGNSSRAAVILCHGYSTASSIAGAVNRMLGTYIFDAIDVEMELNNNSLADKLNDYILNKSPINELLLLVDMGSLQTIYQNVKEIGNCNVGIMNNVSTQLALEAANLFNQNKGIDEILKSIKDSFEIKYEYIEGKNKPNTILCICSTGLGGAKAIRELLIKCLPKKIPYEIITYEHQALVENGTSDPIFQKYNVKLVIGTLDPKLGEIPFIPVEDLMMNDDADALENIVGESLTREELSIFNENVMKNFAMTNLLNNLTILNAEKVIEDVESIVDQISKETGISIDVTRRAGLYIHISCLIERLMLKNEITTYDGLGADLKKNEKIVEIIRDAFSVAKSKYSVEIPDAEIIFIINYLKNA